MYKPASPVFTGDVGFVLQSRSVENCRVDEKMILTKHVHIWYHIQVPEMLSLLPFDGEMSERLKEPVLKTGDVKASVGSNPTLSAIF